MRKILKFFSVIASILSQSEDRLIVKINFLYSITAHYFLKIFRVKYSSFPEMNIGVEDCLFKTRKNTLDFWMVLNDYESDIFREIKLLPKEYSVFVDVGANIGRYSVVMAKKGLKVYSFEPLSSNFKQLRLNAWLNKVEDKINFNNIALGNEESEKEIFFQKDKHGEASLIIKNGLQKESVKVMRLDKILNKKFKEKVILKIDVEGFEYEVLEGAKKFIGINKPVIIVEIWNKQTEKFLSKINYKLVNNLWYPSK